jgi:drug/metabolite transporter (DMT)-like permease
LFAKALYQLGMSHHEVAAVRAVLAVPGFFVIAWLYSRREKSKPSTFTPPRILAAVFAGLLCYYLGSLANFYALTIIQANVERALLFSYPAIVVALQAVLARQLPNLATVLALVATTTGIVLVTGALDGGLTLRELIGVGWIIFCSFTIAIYFLVSGHTTQHIGSAYFTTIAMTAAGGAFAVHFSLFGRGWLTLLNQADIWLTMSALVLFATVLPLFFISEGVRRIGASRAALISTLGPPATAVMAYELYGETLSPSQLLGTCIVIVGIAFIELHARRGRQH